MKSDSLITARLVNDQGGEVFDIPGSIHNLLSKGGHTLIRWGAKLVETVEDILDELKHYTELSSFYYDHEIITDSKQKSPLDPEHENILNGMGSEPISIDTLIERSGLEVGSSSLYPFDFRAE
ncbi:MAG: hypothetical protein P8X88_03290 [Gammaproteobacteria bacterium]